MSTIKKTRKEECLGILQRLLPPGSTVWCNVTHVSQTGMSRRIAFYVIRNNEPRMISSYIADILGYTYNDKEGSVQVSGCGMDMGFHVVQSLSYALHGMNDVGDGAQVHQATPESYRAVYSLEHRWL